MAAGVDAVKVQLAREFGPVEIQQGFDLDNRESTLYFECDGLDYRVSVNRDYDNDYPRTFRVDLSGLGKMLRLSANRRLRVSATGINPN